MTSTVLVLRAPSTNRVYTRSAGALSHAEAHWVLGARARAGGQAPTVRERLVSGMDALEVTLPDADEAERERTLRWLGRLSASHGLLEVVREDEQGGAPLLRPLEVPAALRHPDDLETVQRYPGKTNEQFTALLVNLAAALSTRGERLLTGELDLLDPMCGRGTTLSRALRLGLSPIGAEIDAGDVEAYRTTLATWLRTHRFKHRLEEGALSLHGRRLGRRLDVELAPDKQAQKAGEGQSLTVLGCDARRLGELLPARSLDVIVADLPYGVQHGSKGRERWERSPRELLAELAPVWAGLLREGGAVALAANRHTLDHQQAADALAAADLRLVSADGAFRHRVDQSIDRDVLLAVPARHPRREQLEALGRTPLIRPDQEDPA